MDKSVNRTYVNVLLRVRYQSVEGGRGIEPLHAELARTARFLFATRPSVPRDRIDSTAATTHMSSLLPNNLSKTGYGPIW